MCGCSGLARLLELVLSLNLALTACGLSGAVGVTEATRRLYKQIPFLVHPSRRIRPAFHTLCLAVVNSEDSNPVRFRFALDYVAA